MIGIFNLMLPAPGAQVVARRQRAASQIADPGFDFEAASNLSRVLAHLTAAELQLEAAESWIDALALRFCTTRRPVGTARPRAA
jgi:hypothetical protein